jgi:uncharacterized RDD family membrane protein YckC
MSPTPAFFVRGEDGEEYGPVDFPELREWIAENRVGLGTSVRPDSPNGSWNLWQHYPELVALLAEVHVTGGAPALPVLAPLGRRSLAFGLDVILTFVFMFPALMVNYSFLPRAYIAELLQFWQDVFAGMTQMAMPEPPTWYILNTDAIFLVISTLYFAGCYAGWGRTLAKWMLNLQVVDAQGRKPTPGKAVVRALVFTVSVYFFYGIPLFYAFFNPQRRALHDIFAGTYVVES